MDCRSATIGNGATVSERRAIKVDAREGKAGRLRAKAARVQELVGRKLEE